MDNKDILKDVKPSPYYKLYPKSKITIRVFYAVTTIILVLAIWRN